MNLNIPKSVNEACKVSNLERIKRLVDFIVKINNAIILSSSSVKGWVAKNTCAIFFMSRKFSLIIIT
jgi:hypothetical protein